MKKFFLLVLGLTLMLQALPQEKKPFVTLDNLEFSARADFTLDCNLAHDTVGQSIDHGFSGKYLVVALDGTVGSKFSYHLRQRLNTPNIGFANTFFQGTDWAYLDWHFTDNLFLSAGKQVVAIGGWEYDTNPLDIYYGTEFWNTVCCYSIGASINYKDDSGKNLVLLQMCNSPFINEAMESIYSYNLMWYGNFDIFKTTYSVNMIEYMPGKFINYIALGNKLQFNGVEMYLDIIHRASLENKQFFGQAVTGIYGIGVDIGPKWIVFAKAGYDYNPAGLPNAGAYDPNEIPKKNVDFESVGFEYYPLGDRSLRLHLCGSHSSADGVGKYEANLGLTWKVDLLHSVLKK